jgi:hypothetical protein
MQDAASENGLPKAVKRLRVKLYGANADLRADRCCGNAGFQNHRDQDAHRHGGDPRRMRPRFVGDAR